MRFDERALTTAIEGTVAEAVAAHAAAREAGAHDGMWAPAAERARCGRAAVAVTTAKRLGAEAHANATEAYWMTFEERSATGAAWADRIARAMYARLDSGVIA